GHGETAMYVTGGMQIDYVTASEMIFTQLLRMNDFILDHDLTVNSVLHASRYRAVSDDIGLLMYATEGTPNVSLLVSSNGHVGIGYGVSYNAGSRVDHFNLYVSGNTGVEGHGETAMYVTGGMQIDYVTASEMISANRMWVGDISSNSLAAIGTTLNVDANSFVVGSGNLSVWDYATVVGRYNATKNVNVSGNPVFVVGGGWDDDNRYNILEVIASDSIHVTPHVKINNDLYVKNRLFVHEVFVTGSNTLYVDSIKSYSSLSGSSVDHNTILFDGHVDFTGDIDVSSIDVSENVMITGNLSIGVSQNNVPFYVKGDSVIQGILAVSNLNVTENIIFPSLLHVDSLVVSHSLLVSQNVSANALFVTDQMKIANVADFTQSFVTISQPLAAENGLSVNNMLYVDTLAPYSDLGTTLNLSHFKSLVLGDARVFGNYSTAWGQDTHAIGTLSTAFGYGTWATGNYSTAWGQDTHSIGTHSTAFGYGTWATGNYSTAWGQDTHAIGTHSTAFGYGTWATEYYSTAWGQDTHAIGILSTAFGYDTWATGNYSTAWGNNNKASNDNATAFGWRTLASGSRSTAFGHDTLAQGWQSTAFGQNTIAQGSQSTALGLGTHALWDNSMVVGQYNITENLSISGNPVFVVGGGEDEDNRYNVMEVFATGNGHGPRVAIYDALYVNEVFVTGDHTLETDSIAHWDDANNELDLLSHVLITPRHKDRTVSYDLPYALSVSGDVFVTGAVYLSSLKDLNGDDWQFEGSHFLSGNNILNEGLYSSAWGMSNISSGDYATSWGYNNDVSGFSPTAWGSSNIVSGNRATAFGDTNQALNDNATAFGWGTIASGSRSTAFGHDTSAQGFQSTAFGRNTIAQGDQSTALGYETQALWDNSMVLGQYNLLTSEFSNITSSTVNGLRFVVGNGSSGSRKSVFEVGDVQAGHSFVYVRDQLAVEGKLLGVGAYSFSVENGPSYFGDDLTVYGTFTNSSDVSLKKDIHSLDTVLSKVLNLRPVSFRWEDVNKGAAIQYGFIAQEVEELFPSLVVTSLRTGDKALKTMQFTSLLVKSVQELHGIISSQQSEIEQLKRDLEGMKSDFESRLSALEASK
ncbi:MAG: tail fiber domain-containing protein, partial [bacterium]